MQAGVRMDVDEYMISYNVHRQGGSKSRCPFDNPASTKLGVGWLETAQATY